MNATAKSAILAETTKLSGDEITAVQKELLAILKSGILEDGRRSNDSDDGVMMVRQAARAACLFSKLNQLEQDDVFGQLPESERGEAFKMIRMFSAMMADPKPLTAEKYAEKLAGTTDEIERMANLSKWGANDPAGLLRYWKTEAAKPNAPEWTIGQMGNSFLEIGLANPRLLMREAMTLDDPSLRQKMLQLLHLNSLYTSEKSQWAADNDGLLKQLMTERPENREDELSGVLSMRLKRESPEEARAWVESLELGPGSKDWTDKALFSAWRSKDRNAAAEWMLEHTPPEQRADRIAEYVSWWTEAKLPKDIKLKAAEPDIASCADWIVSLGIKPDTEKGISVLADGWIQAGEPAAALAWAQAIPDPATRANCLEKVTTQIERRYPDTWRAMLNAANIATP